MSRAHARREWRGSAHAIFGRVCQLPLVSFLSGFLESTSARQNIDVDPASAIDVESADAGDQARGQA